MCWDAVWRMGDARYDALRCRVMNGWCKVWCIEMVWWMGDAWYDALVVWCVMWMKEWINERINEWTCGQCRTTVCILLYFICICNMFLYVFRACYMWRINTIIPYGQAFVVYAQTRLVTIRLSNNGQIYLFADVWVYPTLVGLFLVSICQGGSLLKSKSLEIFLKVW